MQRTQAIRIVGVLLASALASAAAATTERAASIIAFPKVIADQKRDTVIEITNVSNNPVSAHCFYRSGGPACEPAIDFDLTLTKEQPIHWVVSRGRTIDPLLNQGGFDPGAIPPRTNFMGILECIQVDAAGAPFLGDALVGEATLTDLASGDVAKVNAFGIRSTVTPGEFEACSQSWTLDHAAEGAADVVVGAGSAIHTDLTIEPCTQNFENLTVPTLTINFLVSNELEQTFMASTTFNCWLNTSLSNISSMFSRATLGTDAAQTRITSTSGFIVVGQEFHVSSRIEGVTTSAAINAYTDLP